MYHDAQIQLTVTEVNFDTDGTYLKIYGKFWQLRPYSYYKVLKLV